jgi:microcompartment protein CcmL/EutN
MTVDNSVIVLGVLEFSSIAIGISALDEMVKIAPIKIIDARTMCPGKYLIVFSGDVASVEYSYHKGLEIGTDYIVDKLLINQIHSEVLNSIGKVVQTDSWGAIGIIETNTVASSIEAADIAAKESGVKIVEIRLAIGFGGKSYVKMIGGLHEVQASMEVGVANVVSKNQLCAKAIISQPHQEIKPFFMN